MLPSRHIVVSLPLAAGVGFFTQSVLAGFLCFASGVLIDIDHLIEYTIYHGFNPFGFRRFYRACREMLQPENRDGVKKIYLILHAGEIAISLWVLFLFNANIHLLALALGYTGHLIMDACANVLKPGSYFMFSRIRNGFSTIKLVKDPWGS